MNAKRDINQFCKKFSLYFYVLSKYSEDVIKDIIERISAKFEPFYALILHEIPDKKNDSSITKN